MIRNAVGPAPLSLAMDPFDTDGDQHLGDLLAQLAAAGVDLPGLQAADPACLPQDAGVAVSANGFFDANREVMERYFAQQTHLVELALRNAAPQDRIALTERALAAVQDRGGSSRRRNGRGLAAGGQAVRPRKSAGRSPHPGWPRTLALRAQPHWTAIARREFRTGAEQQASGISDTTGFAGRSTSRIPSAISASIRTS